MSNRSAAVDRFMEGLMHPRKAEIEAIRSAILASNDRIAERIKWNAPSFGRHGEDRLTFKLQPKDQFQIVFHRGVKKDSTAFAFHDETGLMTWASADRAVVSVEDVATTTESITALVNRWIAATT